MYFRSKLSIFRFLLRSASSNGVMRIPSVVGTKDMRRYDKKKGSCRDQQSVTYHQRANQHHEATRF